MLTRFENAFNNRDYVINNMITNHESQIERRRDMNRGMGKERLAYVGIYSVKGTVGSRAR